VAAVSVPPSRRAPKIADALLRLAKAIIAAARWPGFVGWALVVAVVLGLVDWRIVAWYGPLVLVTAILAEGTGFLAAGSVYNAENARETNERVVAAIRAFLSVPSPPSAPGHEPPQPGNRPPV
jgi:hypothetical protein